MRPQTTLDRAPQHLPVPLGGLAPAHRNEPRLSRTWRVQQTRIISAGGLMLGLVGGWLAVATPAISVYADGSSDEIGSCGLLRPESAAILNVPVPVGLIGFNVSRLACFLCDNPRATDPNTIGFDAFDETEIPVHAERRF